MHYIKQSSYVKKIKNLENNLYILRYEHILQIYWTKGFFFGGKLFYFDQTINDLLSYLPGFGLKFLNLLKQRFELTFFQKNKATLLIDHQLNNHKPITQPLNIIFSQINTVNNKLEELNRLNIIRLYLIKSYRGRSHAIGKPVRGQRTWSNAWNSYNLNKVLRNFISETKKQLQNNSKPDKINYKVVKKKYASKQKKKKEVKKRKLIWF